MQMTVVVGLELLAEDQLVYIIFVHTASDHK